MFSRSCGDSRSCHLQEVYGSKSSAKAGLASAATCVFLLGFETVGCAPLRGAANAVERDRRLDFIVDRLTRSFEPQNVARAGTRTSSGKPKRAAAATARTATGSSPRGATAIVVNAAAIPRHRRRRTHGGRVDAAAVVHVVGIVRSMRGRVDPQQLTFQQHRERRRCTGWLRRGFRVGGVAVRATAACRRAARCGAWCVGVVVALRSLVGSAKQEQHTMLISRCR